MKEKKRRLEPLSFYDHTGIEKHLAKMAKRGWMIERITNQFWTYRKIEPQTLQFAVTYYPNANDFAPGPTDSQQTFYDFSARTGWELACTWFQMQIFHSTTENPIPIDTDPVYEVETIHKACKANYLRAYWFLLIVGLVGTHFLISGLIGHTLHFFSSPSNMVIYTCAFLLFLMCAVELWTYHTWHKKATRAAEDGIFMDTPSTAPFQRVILTVLVISFVLWIINLVFAKNALMVCIAALVFGAIFGTKYMGEAAKRFYKRRKLSAGLNRVLTVLTTFVFGLVLMGTALTVGTLLSRSEVFSESLRIEEAPLKVQDLMETDYQGHITLSSPDSSLLLSRLKVEQRHHFDDEPSPDIPVMKYELYQVRVPALYDFFAVQLQRIAVLDSEEGVALSEVDGAPWGASTAYQLTAADGSFIDRFVLCYEDRLVDIELNWTPTEEQMVIAGEKLNIR